MENLHSDILENILSRLPIEAALYSKRVSKTWKKILRYKTEKQGLLFCHGVISEYTLTHHQLLYEDEYDHYDESKMNYYHSYDTLSKIENGEFFKSCIVGSCNGLVCLAKDKEGVIGKDPFLICNPLTGESVFLSEYHYSELPRDISSPTPLKNSCLSSGFGYCPLTNRYKVVTIFHYQGENKAHIQVYTVGDEWRYIGLVSRLYTFQGSPGIYANGALHWLQTNLRNVEEILAFDLEDEKHSSITLPSSRDFENPYCSLFGGNNNLYLIHDHHNTDSYISHIVIWKLNYHSKSSSDWIKEFNIKLEGEICFTMPFAITKSNEVLLWYNYQAPLLNPLQSGKRLYCYDPKTSTLKKLWDDEQAESTIHTFIFKAVPHKQSIVSLRDLGETNVTFLKDFGQAMKSKSGADKFLEKSRAAKRKKKLLIIRNN